MVFHLRSAFYRPSGAEDVQVGELAKKELNGREVRWLFEKYSWSHFRPYGSIYGSLWDPKMDSKVEAGGPKPP